MTPLRFLQSAEDKYCIRSETEADLRAKTQLRAEIKTLPLLLDERIDDLNLRTLVINIATAIQVTSALLRRMSATFIIDLMGYDKFPEWGDGDLERKVDRVFLKQIQDSSAASVISSPHLPQPITVDQPNQGRRYAVVFSGIDGPSNLQPPASASSSFAVYPCLEGRGLEDSVHVLQAGREALTAGYAIYGSTTTLHIGIKGRNGGAHSFSLATNGDFLLTSEDYLMPRYNTLYVVDEGRCLFNTDKFLHFLENVKNPPEGSHKSISRYSSSTLADIYQVYVKGGLYIRPQLLKPTSSRLPLLVYQTIPAAFVLNLAGGLTVTQENQLLLDITPTDLLQAKSFIMGSFKNISGYLKDNKVDPLSVDNKKYESSPSSKIVSK